MLDSDPRPMPPQVLAAYQDPLDLAGLLASSVFTDKERFAVRDELLKRLIVKHGSVDVEIGKGHKLMPIRKRVAQFKKNVWSSIELLLSVEEYGERDSVLLELAKAMQPYWYRWWESFEWRSCKDVQLCFETASTVLGRRQMSWLAAQYARSVVGYVRASDRVVILDAIVAVETWAITPSAENQKRAKELDYPVARIAGYSSGGYSAAYAASFAVRSISGDGHPYVDYVAYAADAAARAKAVVSGYDAGISGIASLTRRLITPTIITKASR